VKNVGAHKPTKIPKRSPWATSDSLLKNQIAMLPAMLKKPRTKQALPNIFSFIEKSPELMERFGNPMASGSNVSRFALKIASRLFR
jgi:hypothetical protein